MAYLSEGRGSLVRACWRDGRGALRCRRPGMALSGDDLASLPGGAKKPAVSPEVFLVAQLNRFKGPGVPAGQKIGDTKFDAGVGISSQVAIDALTVVIRRLTGSVAVINDENARIMLSDARSLLTSGDPSGTGALIKYVKDNVIAIGNQVAGFADSLGLPPAQLPTEVLGLAGTKLIVAAGVVGIAALILITRKVK